MPFIERGFQLLRGSGFLAYICPSTFLKRDGGSGLRTLIRKHYGINRIIDFGDQQVFEGATNYTGIYFFSSQQPDSLIFNSAKYDGNGLTFDTSSHVHSENLPRNGSMWFIPAGPACKMWQGLKAGVFSALGEIAFISEGIVTGNNDVFLVKPERLRELGLEKEILLPCVRGSEVRPYTIRSINECLVYPYDHKTGLVVPESEMKAKYPYTYQYLKTKRDQLSGRDYFDRSSKRWYELWNERNVQNLFRKKSSYQSWEIETVSPLLMKIPSMGIQYAELYLKIRDSVLKHYWLF